MEGTPPQPPGQGPPGQGPPGQGPPGQGPPRDQGGWAPPAPAPAPVAYPAGGRTPGKATAALVLGIVGLFICPIVCSVLAIIFGIQSRNEIDTNPGLEGRGLAVAGIVLGIIGLALLPIWVLIAL